MGAQCVYSATQNNPQHQILHSISKHHGVMTNSRRPCKLQAKDSDDFQKYVCEEGTDCSYNFGQFSNQMDNSEVFQSFQEEIIKNQNDRKSKKRIHLMLPKGQSEETLDNVIFLSGQITSPHLSIISSAIQDHCIFSQLTDNQRRYLICKMRYCKSIAGSYIFQQGNQSQSFYILIEGQCRVQINGETKRVIEKGSYFGDLGVIYCAPRSASIFSEKQCMLAELSNKEFRQILQDLSSMSEKENRQFLENISFYQQLNELQKNVLASSCVTEFYHSGQTVFNKGDVANSLYLVKQGVVSIAQKNIDIKKGQNFGMNEMMAITQTQRPNSIIAKTDCRLLSLTRGVIINNLGNDIGQIIRQNLILKILKQSRMWKTFNPQQWTRALQKMTATSFNKNDLIFTKGTIIEPLKLTIILSTDAICNSNVCYKANSIIQPGLAIKKKQITFEQDFYSNAEGYCVTLDLTKQKMKSQIYVRSNSGNINKNSTDIDCIKEGKQNILCLKDFIVLKKLRCGNYGKVYACYNKKTAEKYAIKVINKTFMAACKLMSYVRKEEQLLRTLPQHPFIVKSHAVFKDDNFYMIVMNLLEGEDMFDAINSRLPLPESQCKFFISQLFLVIEHLHNNKVIYRDMKPQNVMLNMDGYLTLVDMGTAKRLDIQNRFKTNTIIGTPHYMAPEIIIGKGYGFGVDWWSLGVMLYEMATGKLPYGQTIQDPFLVYRQILQVQLSFPTTATVPIKEMLSKILVKSPDKRLKNGFLELKSLAFFANLDWDKLLRRQFSATIFPHKSCQIDPKIICQKISKKQPCAFQIFLKDKQKGVEMLQES